MKKLSLAFCAALVAAASLVSCGAPAASKDLTVFNWIDYIPESVLDDFKAQTGINLVYDTYDSNESMYATPLAPHWEGDKLVDWRGNVIADETPQAAGKGRSGKGVQSP